MITKEGKLRFWHGLGEFPCTQQNGDSLVFLFIFFRLFCFFSILCLFFATLFCHSLSYFPCLPFFLFPFFTWTFGLSETTLENGFHTIKALLAKVLSAPLICLYLV